MINLPVVLAYQQNVDHRSGFTDGSPYAPALNDPLYQSSLQTSCIPFNDSFRHYSWLSQPWADSYYTVAFSFLNLGDLVAQVRAPINLQGTLQGRCNESIATNVSFQKLVIDAHGDPGIVYMAGLGNENEAIRFDNLWNHSASLTSLFNRVLPGGTILFTSCHTGQGQNGDELLRELSSMVRGRKFIAFSTYNISVPQESRRTYYSQIDSTHPISGARLNIQAALDEHNPNAKIFLNGNPIKMPQGEGQNIDFDANEGSVITRRRTPSRRHR